MITKHGIRVESYVHRADGSLVNFDELQGEERVRAATELKKRYLNIDFSRLSFDSNDGPREIFFNTKVKKYKRLAIYIRNNTVNEGFGVFAITKNFVKGNYAKR